METHKEFTKVAYVLDGRDESVHHHGRIQTTKPSLVKLARQFQSQYPQARLHVVYEVGSCGYWLYRLLTCLGHVRYVVAPSWIPKKPGDRVKPDKRDARMLAERLKQSDLTPIYVPEPEDEAIRDLSLARESALHDVNEARYQ